MPYWFSDYIIENNFIKPYLIPINFSKQKNTSIVAGRNPIVEQLLTDNFVANDISFNKNQTLIILTGPNASGKVVSFDK